MISHGLFYFSYCFLLLLLLSVSLPNVEERLAQEAAHKYLLRCEQSLLEGHAPAVFQQLLLLLPFPGSCRPTGSAVSSCFQNSHIIGGGCITQRCRGGSLPNSVQHCVIQDISALLNRSPHLMEPLYKHFLVVLPSLDSGRS